MRQYVQEVQLRWPCPRCGAGAGEPCLNLRRLHAFNPNRLTDQPRHIKRLHYERGRTR